MMALFCHWNALMGFILYLNMRSLQLFNFNIYLHFLFSLMLLLSVLFCVKEKFFLRRALNQPSITGADGKRCTEWNKAVVARNVPQPVPSNRLQRSSLFVFVHPCLFRYCGNGSYPYTASSAACANPLTCRPSPPTPTAPLYPPATLCSTSKTGKKSLILSSNSVYINEMPPALHVHVCECVLAQFLDCLCVCQSDCSLEPRFTVPQVIGNLETNGCWTDCLFAVQQYASGVNRNIFFFLMEPCFLLLY